MTTRPIIFSAPMVRALLAGRKMQTRRLLRVPPAQAARLDIEQGYPDPGIGAGGYLKAPSRDGETVERVYPFCEAGDRLWVKESHRLVECDCTETCRVTGRVWYEADASGYHECNLNRLRPSIFMPRWASRLTLDVTAVRVERLLDISEADAEAESFRAGPIGEPLPETPIGDGWTISSPGAWASAAGHFQSTWAELHPEWDGYSSPWVAAITFRVLLGNVDGSDLIPVYVPRSAEAEAEAQR